MTQQAGAASPDDLQAAFSAAFGRTPPARAYKFQDGENVSYRLAPLILVRLTGTRFALIASESFDGAHSLTGAAAVAYLNNDAGKWRLVRVWYEVVQSGSFGVPFIAAHAYRFGATPLFVGEGQYCGMGACTAWYAVVGLYPDGPVSWDAVPDAGKLEPDFNDIADGEDGLTGCGGYDYSSFISAPRVKSDLMRITYKGWMIPGGAEQRRRDVGGSTEVSVGPGGLGFRPAVRLPNCGQ